MQIKIISEYVENTITIEKSRFITELFYVENEEEAKEIIQSIREKHPKAVHHCYAYIIRKEYQNIENQSDDGEPSKTAGLPMLEILRYEKLVNTLVVVTRYFGGVLLGTGGLIRAYSSSVKQAVDLSNVREAILMNGYEINIDYSLSEMVSYEIKNNQGIIKNIDYLDDVKILFYIEKNDFDKYLINKTNNSIKISQLDSVYMWKYDIING